MNNQFRIPHLIAVLLCVLSIHSTYQFHKEIESRIGQQEKLIETRELWNTQIAAMQPLEDLWKTTLPTIGTLSDQYRIIQRIDAPSIGLTLVETGIAISDPAPLAYNGAQIGLLRYPIANQGNGLTFTASDFTTAWNALAKLQARPDIRYTRARLESAKGIPTLSLENFSLIARAEIE